MHLVAHLKFMCKLRHELLVPLDLDLTQALVLRRHAANGALEPALASFMENRLVLRDTISLHFHLNCNLVLGA